MMAEYVPHGLIYIICDVYTDDTLISGREYDVTLNPKIFTFAKKTLVWQA